ncbi:MAG: phosphoglycerate dehydrogenase, partial [Nitrososphaerota archaeon]
MKKILVGSRSFGEYSSVGKEVLENSGFVLKNIGPESRPLDEEKLSQILEQEKPHVYICGAEPISEKVLLATSELKLIMKHGIGIDNIDLNAATRLGIAVANTPGANTCAVADFTVMAILALLRNFYQAVYSTKLGEWKRFLGNELGCVTVGLIGTGRIGKEVARRLFGFGANILAYDVVQDLSLVQQYNVHYISFEELLGQADVISLHLPLTSETRRIIGRKEFSMMKPTAYLVNMARGELIDESALYKALKDGLIAGAALDVYTKEPPQDSPLLALDNVLVTPHIAAYTKEAME